MTVQELIDQLNLITDKQKQVVTLNQGMTQNIVAVDLMQTLMPDKIIIYTSY